MTKEEEQEEDPELFSFPQLIFLLFTVNKDKVILQHDHWMSG